MTFMEQYHSGTMRILDALGGELDQIGALGSRAAGVLKRGGTVWTSMNVGHMPIFEQADDRRGNPGLMKQHTEFSGLQSGDLVFTNFCNREVLEARERGVYVVCVTTPYRDDEFRPPGFTDISHGNPDDLMLADVANEILQSHMPYQQGLVDTPEFPEFRLCPCATTGSGSIHWMLNAEIAAKSADPDVREGEHARQYLAMVNERIVRSAQHMPSIQQTAATMAERVLDGGCWFAKSLEHPGFETEFNVASGPRVVNHGDWGAAMDKNVMLISAISPAFGPEMDLAEKVTAEGAFLLCIGVDSIDGNVPEKSLFDVADVGFDTFSPESGGVVKIPGTSKTVCPTSGIVGNVIQQMISAQWAQQMITLGAVPTFLRGVYQAGGREYNDDMTPLFEQRGY